MSSSSTVVPLTSSGATTPLARKIPSFNGLLPRTFSGSSIKTRLSFRSPSGGNAPSSPSAAAPVSPMMGKPPLLSREESKLLMERILLVLRHLRARVECERRTHGLTGQFINRAMPASSFCNEAKKIAYSDTLTSTMQQLSIETLAGVVKLCFQTQDAPMLDMACGKELEQYFTAGTGDLARLKQILQDKLSARALDILTQLMAVLHADDESGVQAYSWGPTLFLPRFDSAATSITKQYEEEVDVMKWSQMSVTLTQVMVQSFAHVFVQRDEKVERLVSEMIGSTAAAAASSTEGEDLCRVVFAFVAEESHELTASEGEILQVLERGTDGWWSCRNDDGQTGLVPSTYVEPYECGEINLNEMTSVSLLNANSEIIDEQIAQMQQNLVRLVQLKQQQQQQGGSGDFDQTFCSDYLPSQAMGPPPPAPMERPKSSILSSPARKTTNSVKFAPPIPSERPKSNHHCAPKPTPAATITTAAAAAAAATVPAAAAPSPVVDEEAERRADAYKTKGNEKLNKGEYLWAVECYTQALELSPRGANSHLFLSNRAAAHMHLMDYEAAIADCMRAKQLKPDFAKAYSRLAQAQLSLGRTSDARASANRALELDPGSEIVRATLAKLDQMSEQVEETVQV